MKESFKRNILRDFSFYINHEARTQTKLLGFQEESDAEKDYGKQAEKAKQLF